MCVSFGDERAWPRLLQILMTEFRQEPFFFLSSHPKVRTRVGGQRGWPSCQGGVEVQGKATGAHWTVQTADLTLWPRIWQAWEQWGLCRLHCHNQTRSKCWWMTGCIEHATTHSFNARIKSRQGSRRYELLLLRFVNVPVVVRPQRNVTFSMMTRDYEIKRDTVGISSSYSIILKSTCCIVWNKNATVNSASSTFNKLPITSHRDIMRKFYFSWQGLLLPWGCWKRHCGSQ